MYKKCQLCGKFFKKLKTVIEKDDIEVTKESHELCKAKLGKYPVSFIPHWHEIHKCFARDNGIKTKIKR